MTLGEYLKKMRKADGCTMQQFGEIFDITTTYISQVENNKKVLSKKLFFEIIYYMYYYQRVEGVPYLDDVFSSFAEAKHINEDELIQEFEKYKEKRLKAIKNISEGLNSLKSMLDRFQSNRLVINRNNEQVKVSEYPYFDLEWLLTQRDFQVFYGRDYYTNEKAYKSSNDINERLLFNKLSDEDKITINNIIKEFLRNKYKNKQDDDFF